MKSPGKRTPRLTGAGRKIRHPIATMRKSSRPGNLDVRCCIACGYRVTNRNLGGWSGRGSLSGSVWCERCADKRQTGNARFEPRHASIVNDALWIILTVAELSRTPENKELALRLRLLGRKLKHEANQLAFNLYRRRQRP
jgi:hypothetical protein